MFDIWWVDVVSAYLYGLKMIAMVVAVGIMVSCADDLFIDLLYWSRFVWRKATVYRKYKPLDYKTLYGLEEQPLAIMVPAWHETNVIGKMAELAAIRYDYENYQIFVGTYPNDPDTQRDVDEVCARFPNIQKVVCARPGPTSKADCLNNILDAILQFEKSAGVSFAGFILHDAEDVISDMELRLFNYLVPRKDLIQIPVYPFERPWYHFTALHYLDEFAEMHGKDLLVREWLAGQVPSAGVGTCFSRRAILALLEDGDGIAFDVSSLTEDYDIGFRLKKKGLQEIFVRFPVVRKHHSTSNARWMFGMRDEITNVVCVREYFPETFSTAVRQKSRWIIGIIYQGFKTHKWNRNWIINYFLWRDRKGVITNFLSFIASLIFLQLLVVLIYQLVWPDAYHFMSIFESDPWFILLLKINGVLMLHRIIQRILFVSGYYGLLQGLMSILRLVWGNLINFAANWRALSQVVAHGDPRRVAWDKTSHEFPSLGERNRSRQSLGETLIDLNILTRESLHEAITTRPPGLALGTWLLHQNFIGSPQLAEAVAQQSGAPVASIDAYRIPAQTIAEIPASLALHYGVLPVGRENDQLVLASEFYIDPVSLSALARKLQTGLVYRIALKGEVTVGLRHWYARGQRQDPKVLLDEARKEFGLSSEQCERIWNYFVSRQILLGETFVALGRIDEAAMRQLLLHYEHSDLPLGRFLLQHNIITESMLGEALSVLDTYQASMPDLLRQAGVDEQWIVSHLKENP